MDWLGRLFVNGVLLAFAAACVLPLVLVVSASFTTDAAIFANGYTLLPVEFSTAAYRFVLGDPTQIVRAYALTAFVAVVGTMIGLTISALLGYALSRGNFSARRPLSFVVFFTLLFNGGLIPFYLFVVQTLQLKNSILALILPLLVNGWNVLLLRTSFKQVAEDLLDAARIDGASEWRIFFQIVVPVSTPVLATVGLFILLGYWNDWWMSLLFIDRKDLYSLQFLLYQINQSVQAINSNPQVLAQLGMTKMPAETTRMALAVLAIGPIAFAYLFLQRYFVRGITIGSIK
jgi:putative aldouronate transport system permease protein